MVSFPSVMVADAESSVADEQAARDTNSALAPTRAPRATESYQRSSTARSAGTTGSPDSKTRISTQRTRTPPDSC